MECVWSGGDSVFIWECGNLRWCMNCSVRMYGGGYVARVTECICE